MKWATGLHAFSDVPGFDPPDTFPILSYGEHAYSCNGKACSLHFTRADAERIRAAFLTRKTPLVIDYEHRTLSGDEAPAAGWIDALEVGENALLAAQCRWTEKGAAYLKNGEYAYFSPVLFFNENVICMLHSLALTNHPALHAPMAFQDAPDGKRTEEAVDEALQRGQLLRCQRTWALSFAEAHPEAFRAFCNTAPAIGPAQQAFSDTATLNLAPDMPPQTDRDLLRLAGLSPEQITRFQKGSHTL